jgi:hypothetical protein
MKKYFHWKPLQLSEPGSDGVGGPLLVSYDFSTTAYTVSVTNLAHLWTESLDRRAIIRRALNEDSSIDPSEDTEQFRILLDHIKRAVSGDDRCRRAIQRKSANELLLRLVSPLPAPLEALEWTLTLTRASSEALAEKLILPILRETVDQQAHLQNLLGELRDKDHVIEKMLDKLLSSGTDIASVFPAAAGLRVDKHDPRCREKLGTVVRGLGGFDESRLDRGHPSLRRSNSSADFLLDALFSVPGEGDDLGHSSGERPIGQRRVNPSTTLSNTDPAGQTGLKDDDGDTDMFQVCSC